MPLNFPKNNLTQFPDLFGGDPDVQVIATRDALLNYTRLMEDIGPTTYAPPAATHVDGVVPVDGGQPKVDAVPADAAAAIGGESEELFPPTAKAELSSKSSSVAAVIGEGK